MPRWLRRFAKRPSAAADTPERQRELHDKHETTGKFDPKTAAKDMLGADAIFLPRKKR